MNGFSFNPNEVEDEEFALIPKGRYVACIEYGEFLPTKSGSGSMFKFIFSILEGEFKGRNIFTYVNFKNPNADAQRIGLIALKRICQAIGLHGEFSSVDQLTDKVMLVDVGVKAATSDYPAKNVTTNYHAYDANAHDNSNRESQSSKLPKPPTAQREAKWGRG